MFNVALELKPSRSRVAEQPCFTLFDRDMNFPIAVMPP